MCGITGFIDKNANYDVNSVATSMGDSIRHRGPDSSGVWSDINYGVYLVHRRLAILDLSAAGHQPMVSVTGRYVLVFNGEIYNFKAILADVEDVVGKVILRGHSDTEVILLAIETFGFESALKKFEGMFAIAMWDKHDNSLYLARDRVGEKPLYYGYFNSVFGFASELSSLKQHPKFSKIVDRNAISQMMLHNCIPAPLSIYHGVYKLLAGSYIKLSYDEYTTQSIPVINKYWELANHVNTNKYTGSIDDAVADLEKLLLQKISDQMVSDVPLGCFLSGGIDSSTIAALMQKQSTTPVKTFSIGFDNPEYDEAQFAKEVAKHLGTEHYELYVTEKDALSVVESLPVIYDEPFSDSSQIPTYLVSKLAKDHVTVCLSGDGGDELFAGYNRYLYASNIFAKSQKIPRFIKDIGLKLLPLLKPSTLEAIAKISKIPITNMKDKLYKLESLLSANDFRQFYIGLTSHWTNHNSLVIGSSDKNSLWNKPASFYDNNLVLLMQYLDCLGYMADDILVKVDRAAMANSLETRVPLLNHSIIEFAFNLPQEYKIHNGVSKYPLRQVLYKHVPKHLIERPKRGFAIPLNKWLRGELKDWAYNLLSQDKLKHQGYFNSDMILDKLNAHMNGTQDNGYHLWDILMFQQWLEHNC